MSATPRRERFPGERDLKDRALDAAAEGFSIADLGQPGQPLIYVNQGFERLTGYRADEVLGSNCRLLQGPDTDPAAREAIRGAIRDRRETVVEILNYRRDGTPFWNRLSLTPVRDASGQATHFIGVQSDVTARRVAEERLREANRQLEIAGERTRRDLEAAAAVQRSLLPVDLPEIPGTRFAWSFTPSEHLAGDVLGIVPLDDHQAGVYIIDVAGHGVTASLLSVTLSHWLEPGRGRSPLVARDGSGHARDATPPAVVAERLSTEFPFDARTALYFTMLYGIIDANTRRFRYVCAGHPAPVLLSRSGEGRQLEASGFPIGILPHATWEESSVALEPGDRLFVFSDGLVEARNEAEAEFGVESLIREARATRHLPLAQSLSAIVQAVRAWVGPTGESDDLSVVAMEAD